MDRTEKQSFVDDLHGSLAKANVVVVAHYAGLNVSELTKLRGQMRTEIARLQKRLGITTVYVTHDQVEAMTMADKIVVLHDGVVEQIGSPLELYDRPANLFVAGFIGSPAMNMIQGVIRPGATPAFEAEDGTRLPLSSVPGNSDGRKAIYGFRPEHLALGGPVKTEITVIEPTGSETQVVAKLAGQKIVGVFRERISARPGEVLSVAPNLSSVHLFDAASGQRLQ